ncbi:hypothetical protein OK074_8704 [Actinobacteria bacterium OK074]|nr:hypothetical protein OK074_8704 [Actinobacteria bacterium OK074]
MESGLGMRLGLGMRVALGLAAVFVVGGATVPARAEARDTPDLALVIAGDTGRSTTLRPGQDDFAWLWKLLRPMSTDTERVPDAWEDGDYPRVRATVVWALTGIGGWPYTERAPGGDVAIERQDQLLVADDGTPWVRSDPAPDIADDDIRWHRGSKSVYARLERAGVFGTAAEPAADSRDGDTAAEVRWGLWGLGAGRALGAGGVVLRRRWADRREAGPPNEPRHELIDL